MSKKTFDADDAAPLASAPAADARRPIEHWRDECGTPASTFAGVKLGKGWPIGQEVTREDYEAAVKWATSFPCR